MVIALCFVSGCNTVHIYKSVEVDSPTAGADLQSVTNSIQLI